MTKINKEEAKGIFQTHLAVLIHGTADIAGVRSREVIQWLKETSDYLLDVVKELEENK